MEEKKVSYKNICIYNEIKEDLKSILYKLEGIANNQKGELNFAKNDIERSNKLNELIDTQKIVEKLKKIQKTIDLNINLKAKNDYFINILLTDQLKMEFYVKLVEKYMKKYDILMEDWKNYENWKNLIIKS